jgi:hypothetical protein
MQSCIVAITELLSASAQAPLVVPSSLDQFQQPLQMSQANRLGWSWSCLQSSDIAIVQGQFQQLLQAKQENCQAVG